MTKKHGNQKDTSHNIGFAIWRGKFLLELVRLFCNFGKNRKTGNSLAPHRKAVSRYVIWHQKSRFEINSTILSD